MIANVFTAVFASETLFELGLWLHPAPPILAGSPRLSTASFNFSRWGARAAVLSVVIGNDLQWQGIYATMASIAAITVNIAVRFGSSFAIGGIAATFHDVLVTLSCLAFAGYDLS